MFINFDTFGNPYPYEIIPVDMQQFKESFAQNPNTNQRMQLFDNLVSYNKALNGSISPSKWYQWFGGSYTTTKPNPNDVDLVNFIDPLTIINNSDKILHFINSNDNDTAKTVYSVDGYLIPLFEQTDPRYKILLDRKAYWKNWFGHDRNKNPKAVIKVAHK